MIITDILKKRKTRCKCARKNTDESLDLKHSINSKSESDNVSRNEVQKTPKTDFNERKKTVKRVYKKRSDMGYYGLNYLYHSLLRTLAETIRAATILFFITVGYLFMD